MIGLSGTVRLMVATRPVDFRKGMEGLATLVREHMKAEPFLGRRRKIASAAIFLKVLMAAVPGRNVVRPVPVLALLPSNE